MSINLKWDAFTEGLQVSFEAENDHHRSVLPWAEIERLRSQMEADLLSNVPKHKAGTEQTPRPTHPGTDGREGPTS